MARWGRCDYKQLQKLQDNLARLQSIDMDKFCRDASKELAARLLRLVIPATPVGNYKVEVTKVAKRDGKKHKKGEAYTAYINPSGKVGGTLRRGWTGGAAVKDYKAYAGSLPITKTGTDYTIEIINPVEYASYVEFGHRQEVGRFVPAIGKTLKAGWVPGQYMLTKSEATLRSIAPGVLERELEKVLREVFKV